jgi:hypothetical protein
MHKIVIATTALLFATATFANAQQPAPDKNNPRVEQQEKMKNKGNEENQNPNATKGKEQAPATTPKN